MEHLHEGARWSIDSQRTEESYQNGEVQYTLIHVITYFEYLQNMLQNEFF